MLKKKVKIQDVLKIKYFKKEKKIILINLAAIKLNVKKKIYLLL